MQTPKRGSVGSLEQNGWLGFANQPLCNIMHFFLFFFTGSLAQTRREECVAKEQSAWLDWVWNLAVYYVMYLSLCLPILLWVDDFSLKPGSMLHHVFISRFTHSSLRWWLGSETWQYITSCIYPSVCPFFCELMTSVSNQAVCYIMYLSLALPIPLWDDDLGLKLGSILRHVFIPLFAHSSVSWWTSVSNQAVCYIMYLSLALPIPLWDDDLGLKPGSILCRHVFISLFAHSFVTWWLGSM